VDVFKFEMRGFKKESNEELNPISLEKYVNKIQNVKRDISKQILDPQ
jgi:hypothetical protein